MEHSQDELPSNKKSLKNNPDYQNGYFWARRMIPNIGNTRYKTLEGGIEAKEQLVADLKEKFEWDETHKDVADALGMIDAWKEELATRETIPVTIHKLSEEEIREIANSLGITLEQEDIFRTVDLYPIMQKQDPDRDWKLVVEHILTSQ